MAVYIKNLMESIKVVLEQINLANSQDDIPM